MGLINVFSETKMTEKNNVILLTLCSEQALFAIFSQILAFHLNSNKQIRDCFISTCGIHSLDENLNEVKSRVFDWFSKLTTVVQTNFTEASPLKSSFVANVHPLLNLSLRSLLAFCLNASAAFQGFLEHKKNEFLLMKTLNFINQCLADSDYLQTFLELKKESFIQNFASDLKFAI